MNRVEWVSILHRAPYLSHSLPTLCVLCTRLSDRLGSLASFTYIYILYVYKRSLLLQIAFYSSSLLFRRFGKFFFLFPLQYLTCASVSRLLFLLILFDDTNIRQQQSSHKVKSMSVLVQQPLFPFALRRETEKRERRRKKRVAEREMAWRIRFTRCRASFALFARRCCCCSSTTVNVRTSNI